MVNENYIVKIDTQREWDLLLKNVEPTTYWTKSDYIKTFRRSYESESIGIIVENNTINGYSYYKWFCKNPEYKHYNFITTQKFNKQVIHEIW